MTAPVTKKPTLRNPNEIPESRWPLRRNERVCFIDTSLTMGNPSLRVFGRVQLYNPALVNDGWFVRKGRPFYACRSMTDGLVHPVEAQFVLRDTPGNRSKLLVVLATMYEKQVERTLQAAKELKKKADRLLEEAESYRQQARRGSRHAGS